MVAGIVGFLQWGLNDHALRQGCAAIFSIASGVRASAYGPSVKSELVQWQRQYGRHLLSRSLSCYRVMTTSGAN